jgi:hypothetical protein
MPWWGIAIVAVSFLGFACFLTAVVAAIRFQKKAFKAMEKGQKEFDERWRSFNHPRF